MEKVTQIYYTQNQIPINKGKKIQIKVQAENSNKAIGNDTFNSRKDNRFYAVQNRSTYSQMERKKQTKTSLPTVPD